MKAPIRVLLVDSHAVVRRDYRTRLRESGRIVVVAEAASGDVAYRAFCESSPDVVVMNFSFSGGSAIPVLERIQARDSSARVLMVSAREHAVAATLAFNAGACGYLVKSCAHEYLVEAVLAVAGGSRYLSPGIVRTVAPE